MTRATFSALLVTGLLLTGCAYQRDVLRYELGITRVTAPTQARHEPIAEPPDATFQRVLTRNGFRAFLHSNAGDLQTAWHTPHPAPWQPEAIKSVSKALVTAAFATAQPDWANAADAPITHISDCALPEHLRTLTPAILANMSAGFDYRENALPAVYADSGWACRILALPSTHQPGIYYNYGTVQTRLLSLVLQDTLKQPLNVTVNNAILAPIGVSLGGWIVNQDGDVFGGSGFRMAAPDLLKFGELVLNGGRYQGSQVIPADFVATTRAAVFADTDRQSIGYSWGWLLTTLSDCDVQFAEGYGGQMVAVVPETRDVFVFTATTGGLVSARTHTKRVEAALRIVTLELQDDPRCTT